MPASYPTSIKRWSPNDPGFEYPEDLKTIVYARHVVTIYDEVTAIQQQLGAGGVATSGSWGAGSFSDTTTNWGSLRDRLQNIENGVVVAHNNRVATTGGSTVLPSANSVVGLTVRAASGQTANLLEFRNASNQIRTRVESDGLLAGVIDGGSA
jgi:hypothetical protein